MAGIIRGTTPTIEITFKTVTPGELANAQLFVLCGPVKLVKELQDAQAGVKSLVWTLTQKDTLALPEGQNAAITCVWLTETEIRGQSKTLMAYVSNTPKDEVMT